MLRSVGIGTLWCGFQRCLFFLLLFFHFPFTIILYRVNLFRFGNDEAKTRNEAVSQRVGWWLLGMDWVWTGDRKSVV